MRVKCGPRDAEIESLVSVCQGDLRVRRQDSVVASLRCNLRTSYESRPIHVVSIKVSESVSTRRGNGRLGTEAL